MPRPYGYNLDQNHCFEKQTISALKCAQFKS